MSLICKCDRCDAIIKDKRKDGMALRVYDSADIIAGSSVKISADLCSNCVAELTNFLSGANKNRSEEKSEEEEETYCSDVKGKSDRVADTVSDNPDDPCPCHVKHCFSIESCCGCDDYYKWERRHKADE